MKLNHTLNPGYILFLGMVLWLQPMRVDEAASNDRAENCKVVEKPVAQQNTELLHSELLFK